jgi:hypothetical protein
VGVPTASFDWIPFLDWPWLDRPELVERAAAFLH